MAEYEVRKDTEKDDLPGDVPNIFSYAEMPKQRVGKFVADLYKIWEDYYRDYELEDAKRNWGHFENRSDTLDMRESKQAESGKTRSTYYIPQINPAVQTRVANFIDSVTQSFPWALFSPIGGANSESISMQEKIVNGWLNDDDFILKLVERTTEAEIFKYAVCKVFLKYKTRKKRLNEPNQMITLDDGREVLVSSFKETYRGLTGKDYPDEVLQQYLAGRYADEITEIAPSHENIPNGHFIYDPEVKDQKYWRFAGDIKFVSMQYIYENMADFDKDAVERMVKIIKTQGMAGSSATNVQDFHWEIQHRDRPTPKDQNAKLEEIALVEMYIKVIEDKRVKLKLVRVAMNVTEEKDGCVQPIVLKEPEDSPLSTVSFPYVMTWTFKRPHSMLGTSSVDNGADLADMVNDFANLAIDRAIWGLFSIILVRKSVTFHNDFKVEPGYIVTASDISEQAIRLLNLADGASDIMQSMLSWAKSELQNSMAAADLLQGVAVSEEEKLGQSKIRRESSVTRMNLTAIFISRSIEQLAEMFRDMGIQILESQNKITVGIDELPIDQSHFLEPAGIRVLSFMRTGTIQDEFVRAKDEYAQMLQNPIVAQDPTKIWHITRSLLQAYRAKDIDKKIGAQPPASPPAAPPPPGGADPNAAGGAMAPPPIEQPAPAPVVA